MTENVFKPLNMGNTHFHVDHEHIVPNRAYSYSNYSDNGYKKAVLSFANAGATSLFTTVHDLAKWLNNLESGQVGGKAVLESIHTKTVLSNGDTSGYASGLSIAEYKGLKRIGHGGSDAGFRTYVARFPDVDFGVVVLCNLGSISAGGMAMKIADIYLADVFKDDPPGPTEENEGSNEEAVEEETVIVDISEYEGRYYSPELQTAYTLVTESDTLVAHHQRHENFKLMPEKMDQFTGDIWFFGRAKFERDGDGNVSGMRVSNRRVRNLLFTRQ